MTNKEICNVCGKEGRTDIGGDIWYCDNCCESFCSDCFENRFGEGSLDIMIKHREVCLCPSCYTKEIKGWKMTNSDLYEHMRLIDLDVYEMVCAVTTPEGKSDYIVVAETVDLSQLSNEEIAETLTDFCMHIMDLINRHSTTIADLIAECVLSRLCATSENIIGYADDRVEYEQIIEDYMREC